ncbi:helix-turn-helix domain-containing protein [Pseudonocardia kujensis]|uniref:PucR family transcriptional regulator n=1 Tax=Pseudonocardia kujensis TaxID=1128675 RepID=UPI001E54DB67|nr:helix-turn-helix domain-containing protein [Pseudonocardia kujensis]MCE0762458.1 helix-turn-helix domain-containing protein [Pseudonocardia kujensis]
MDRLTVDDVLAELELRRQGQAELLVGSVDREVRTVWLAEDVRDVGECPAHALVVLTRTASREAHGYKLDVVLRQLGPVAGLVLQDTAARPSLSALALARREDLALVRMTVPTDVTDLLTTIVRMLDRRLPSLLERVDRVCREVDRLEAEGVGDEDLLRRSGAAELAGLRLGERDLQLSGVPAVSTDPDGPWLQRRATGGAEDSLARLLAWRLAAAITRRAVQTERAEQLSMLSASDVLNQLLDGGQEDLAPLVRRAGAMGLRVETWNQVVDLEFGNLLALAGDDQVTAYHYAQTLARVASQVAVREGGCWTVAPRSGGVILLRSNTHPRGATQLRELRSSMQTVLDRIVEAIPGVEVLCGVGGTHEGVEGLRASKAEAEAALQSARLRGVVDEPVFFDAPGLSRLLVEWYSSRSVRESIDDLLAPLAALGPSKQKEYSTTLRVYLETNRSVTRTAQQLYLHRNTVAYRINRVLEVLEVDLEDPHQFLALYLACYAQSMPGVTRAGRQPAASRAGRPGA